MTSGGVCVQRTESLTTKASAGGPRAHVASFEAHIDDFAH